MLSQDRMRTLVMPLIISLFVGMIALVILATSLTMFGGESAVSLRSDAAGRGPTSLRYAHNWDDNPVAYIPEAEVIGHSSGYRHNWDDNPVAYIPETEVIGHGSRYAHNWDDNPVAYIPEAEVTGHSSGYQHNWDDNPVAYIPEAEVIAKP